MIAVKVDAFLAGSDAVLEARLAQDAVRQYRTNEAAQLRAWSVSLACLRRALAGWDAAAQWRLVLEFPMRRLGLRMRA